MGDEWLWIMFGVFVAGILAFDLLWLGRRTETIEPAQALRMVASYSVLALLFGAAVFWSRGRDAGLEYLTAWMLEQSLSLDNIFVWVLIFEHLGVADEAQRRVLFWGIIGAMGLRAIFIFAGVALIGAFDWLLYGFGALVIFSGLRLLRSGGAGPDFEKSRILRFLRRRFNIVEACGDRFFVRRNGARHATHLFLALVLIETTDLAFALDSIPAIFGVTRDPLIVYTSNIFAVLGLRALYFAIAGFIERLHYLRYGLALLLVLIGAKMIGGHFIEVPIWLTMGITIALIGGTAALSLLWRRERGVNEAA